MAIFNFLKKKGEEEKKEEPNKNILPPTPNKPTKMLTELPEFPTTPDEEITPLPKLEPLNELKKPDIDIPLVEETVIAKPVIHPEKNISPEFNELKIKNEKQETKNEAELISILKDENKAELPSTLKDENKAELPSTLKDEVEKDIPLPTKIKMPEKEVFNNPRGPVFVNVKKYCGISNEINLAINIMQISGEVVKRLNSIRVRESNELKKLHDSLDGLNKKIITVDDILSKG